jgi:hypothetical protein
MMVTLPDGTVMPLPDASMAFDWSFKVVLDGQVMDLGIAFRTLLAYRAWADAELDRLRTELADLKSVRNGAPAP